MACLFFQFSSQLNTKITLIKHCALGDLSRLPNTELFLFFSLFLLVAVVSKCTHIKVLLVEADYKMSTAYGMDQ